MCYHDSDVPHTYVSCNHSLSHKYFDLSADSGSRC